MSFTSIKEISELYKGTFTFEITDSTTNEYDNVELSIKINGREEFVINEPRNKAWTVVSPQVDVVYSGQVKYYAAYDRYSLIPSNIVNTVVSKPIEDNPITYTTTITSNTNLPFPSNEPVSCKCVIVDKNVTYPSMLLHTTDYGTLRLLVPKRYLNNLDYIDNMLINVTVIRRKVTSRLSIKPLIPLTDEDVLTIKSNPLSNTRRTVGKPRGESNTTSEPEVDSTPIPSADTCEYTVGDVYKMHDDEVTIASIEPIRSGWLLWVQTPAGEIYITDSEFKMSEPAILKPVVYWPIPLVTDKKYLAVKLQGDVSTAELVDSTYNLDLYRPLTSDECKSYIYSVCLDDELPF